MKKLIMSAMCVASVFAVSAAAETMTGVISEEHCGAAHAQVSDKSIACVEKCVKGGSAPVFLQGDKVLKLDDASKEKVMTFLGKKVTISGTDKDGTVSIDSIQAATE